MSTTAPNRSQNITLALDILAVIVFAAIGRASHEEGLTVLGVAETAGPFLIGLGLGWTIARTASLDPLRRTGGPVIWATTVAGGMVVRQLAGEGTAFSFIVVASIVLGVLLAASRLLTRLLARRAGTATAR